MKRVVWKYRHYLNTRSVLTRAKQGEYFGKIRHTVKHQGPQLALVHFDGNKHPSRVPYDELEFDN